MFLNSCEEIIMSSPDACPFQRINVKFFISSIFITKIFKSLFHFCSYYSLRNRLHLIQLFAYTCMHSFWKWNKRSVVVMLFRMFNFKTWYNVIIVKFRTVIFLALPKVIATTIPPYNYFDTLTFFPLPLLIWWYKAFKMYQL